LKLFIEHKEGDTIEDIDQTIEVVNVRSGLEITLRITSIAKITIYLMIYSANVIMIPNVE
jgi:hypothetical protein